MKLARPGILFLCVANSARSQMAEGLARQLAPDMLIFSAGSEPTSVNPAAIRVMQEIDIDISGHESKSVDDIDFEDIGTVVRLCSDEVCPVISSDVRSLHWPIPDPAGVSGNEEEILAAFRLARDSIRFKLKRLLG